MYGMTVAGGRRPRGARVKRHAADSSQNRGMHELSKRCKLAPFAKTNDSAKIDQGAGASTVHRIGPRLAGKENVQIEQTMVLGRSWTRMSVVGCE